jgi:hypothetical protein
MQQPVHKRSAVPPNLLPASWEVVVEHLTRHRDRCGLGPGLPMSCECGAVQVLVCSKCYSALLLTPKEGLLCVHGQLLIGGGS